MRKVFIPVLVVLLAAPAWATISITANNLGGGVVSIDYSGTELARAYALDIIVDTGANGPTALVGDTRRASRIRSAI